jgi:hypothetical protein
MNIIDWLKYKTVRIAGYILLSILVVYTAAHLQHVINVLTHWGTVGYEGWNAAYTFISRILDKLN